jgi:putative ATP-dependent endonuclease of OLD family
VIFLMRKGNPIPLDNIDDLARHLIRLTPVLRLRDARFMRRIRNGTVPNMPEVEVTARELDFLARAGVASAESDRWSNSSGVVRNGATAGALFFRAGDVGVAPPPDAPPLS